MAVTASDCHLVAEQDRSDLKEESREACACFASAQSLGSSLVAMLAVPGIASGQLRTARQVLGSVAARRAQQQQQREEEDDVQ